MLRAYLFARDASSRLFSLLSGQVHLKAPHRRFPRPFRTSERWEVLNGLHPGTPFEYFSKACDSKKGLGIEQKNS